ncbi:hypothetical protein LZZ85_19815 [Terrimonas sp. NA20]|uniref:Lipocalin-like domain-containing protein n=1 Tax=Terrimonas ginsenosidimutans TaxID=2908004 RepID=A0ABS9KW56_9BACT|nr:hypothetical protein [Terrimonas ginsenosidimutans]MCG2616556.1 hypothetical protein [Terrimonas ginsenosidimutans]
MNRYISPINAVIISILLLNASCKKDRDFPNEEKVEATWKVHMYHGHDMPGFYLVPGNETFHFLRGTMVHKRTNPFPFDEILRYRFTDNNHIEIISTGPSRARSILRIDRIDETEFSFQITNENNEVDRYVCNRQY